MTDTQKVELEELEEAPPTKRGRTLPKVETVVEERKLRGPADPSKGKPGDRYIVIRGSVYEFPGELTGREIAWIQTETGVRGGEIEEAATAGDVMVLCAFAAIAQRRNGESVQVDDLLDLPFGDEENGIDFVEVMEGEKGTRPPDSGDSRGAPATP